MFCIKPSLYWFKQIWGPLLAKIPLAPNSSGGQDTWYNARLVFFLVFFPGRISGFSNIIGFCMFSYFQGYSSFIRSSYLFCHEWGNVLPIHVFAGYLRLAMGIVKMKSTDYLNWTWFTTSDPAVTSAPKKQSVRLIVKRPTVWLGTPWIRTKIHRAIFSALTKDEAGSLPPAQIADKWSLEMGDEAMWIYDECKYKHIL